LREIAIGKLEAYPTTIFPFTLLVIMNPENIPDTTGYDDKAIRRVRDLIDSTPETVGPYRILERIGGGGMGEVFHAEQRSPIRRQVAIKFIKLGMDTKLVIAISNLAMFSSLLKMARRTPKSSISESRKLSLSA